MYASYKHSLPSELVSHVTSGCGQPGREWIAELPRIIARLEAYWSISIQEPFPGVEFNFVAPAITQNGDAVVIKIAPPWEPVEIFTEAAYLQHRNGDGCVRLLSVEHESKALMLERIFPGERLFEHFALREAEAVLPAIDALQTVLRRVPTGLVEIQSLDNWFDALRRYPGTAFPADYAEKALAIYDQLSKGADRAFYLHGDYHPGNIVSNGESGFCVIDPKGVAGHIGYEIAVFLNNFLWWQETKPGIRDVLAAAVDQFSAAFDIEGTQLRKWAFAQMVIGSWWNFDDTPDLYDGSVIKADIWDV